MEDEIKLVDLIKPDILQGIQDIFSQLTGMACICTEADGSALTHGSGYSDFCEKHICANAGGMAMCCECTKYAAALTKEIGSAIPYVCHAGLIEVVAPIMVDDQIVGCLSGGAVLTAPLEERDVKETAEEYGIDPGTLWKTASHIKIKSRRDIERAAHYVYTLAEVLSDIARGNYNMKLATQAIESSSSMKSDFLANMSHEIRTPMNAVIGMAEMALREEMSPAARDYIGQIKSSGKALLNIINDILDYSKIESGKMELSCVEYEPLSLINDLSSIIMTRLTDKPVEFLLDVDPSIPRVLYGDDLRIRQIIINLANNATKFTQHGHVQLVVRHERFAEDETMLTVSVVDTGIGIKKEDIGKLFSSFQQVDSKRNRNVEGTGLGLAITRNLVSLMNGNLSIDSEYEVGSTFTFRIPQKIVDLAPSIELADPSKYAIASFFSREDVAEDFVSDSHKLKVYADDLSGAQDPPLSIAAWLKLHENQDTYIIVDEKMFTDYFEDYFRSNLDSGVGVLLLVEAFSDIRQWNDMPYINIIKKPFSVLNLAGFLEANACHFGGGGVGVAAENDFNFVAPKAHIMIVDDNAINLTVAEGLLEPLKMQIDTVTSGKEAIEKLDSTHYDIIFMDHMMPEMDGVETTRIIRRLHPECNDVPIIALTANAVSGTKEMFLSEGMNDFVPKPIEVRLLISKVRQWLPSELIMRMTDEEASETQVQEDQIPDAMGDLDLKSAFAMLGSKKLFWKVFKDYYRVIESKAELIKKYFDEQDWTNYVVEVHALKSASKQIGASALSGMAAELEAAGNARDIDKILHNTSAMLMKYKSYEAVMAPFCKEEESAVPKEEITHDQLDTFFQRMLTAVDDLDVVEMGNIVEEMDKFDFPGGQKDKFEQLKNAVSDIDVDLCEELVNSWFE